jgi:hypothetical protein
MSPSLDLKKWPGEKLRVIYVNIIQMWALGFLLTNETMARPNTVRNTVRETKPAIRIAINRQLAIRSTKATRGFVRIRWAIPRTNSLRGLIGLRTPDNLCSTEVIFPSEKSDNFFIFDPMIHAPGVPIH